MEFDFSEEVLRRALLNIYSRDFHPATEIEINLFNEIWAKMDKAAKEGISKSKAITPDEDKTVRQMGTGSLAHCFPSGSSLAADGV